MNRRRLARQLATAMADGTPIGWEALVAGATTPHDRATIERLRQLDVSRPRPSDVSRPVFDSLSDVAMTLVATVSAAQFLVALVTLLVQQIRGGPVQWPFPQLAIAIAFAAAAMVLLAARRDRRALPLLAAYLAAAAAFTRPFIGTGAEMGNVAPLYIGLPADAFMPACFWAFAAQFPRVPRFTRFDRLADFAGRIAFIVGTGLVASNLALAYGVDAPGLSRFARGTGTYWELFALFTIPAIATVFWRSRRAEVDERQRVRRFGLALAAGTAPFLVWDVLLFLPGIREWAYSRPAPTGRLAIDLVVLAGFLLTPLLTAFVIVRDRALDLTGWARRATQYALARATLWIAVLAPAAVLGLLIYRNRDQTVNDLLGGPLARGLIGVSVVAVAALAGRGRLLALVDRVFSRSSLDHRANLPLALNRIRNARSRRELLAVLSDEAGTVLGSDRLVVFTPRNQELAADVGKAAPLSGASAIAALAAGDDRLLDLSRDTSQFALLPRADRAWLAETNLSLFIPIRTRGGDIVALVALGPKRDRLPITAEERWLILNLTTAVSAVWSGFDNERSQSASRTVGRENRESAIECTRCGAVDVDRPLPCNCDADIRVAALPALLHGKFRVVRRIGHGAMGVVYLARDIALDRDVALKTLPSVSGAAIERLRHEARAMASVNHDALAVIYGFEVWRETPVLVMEYMRGGTLADRLRRGPLPVADALRLGIRLATGLVALHSAGLLHRDIKPTNIGLTDSGAAKLLDFGVASLVNGPNELAGTPLYWPPEAFEGTEAVEAFDLWALNVVLREAITGQHPVGSRTLNELRNWWHSDRAFLPPDANCVPSIQDYFQHALAVLPGARHQSAREVLSHLRELSSQF